MCPLISPPKTELNISIHSSSPGFRSTKGQAFYRLRDTRIDAPGPTRPSSTQFTHNVEPIGAKSRGTTNVFWGTGVGSVTTWRAMSFVPWTATANRKPASTKGWGAADTRNWKCFSSMSVRDSPLTLGTTSNFRCLRIRNNRRGKKIIEFTSKINTAAKTTCPQVVSVQLTVVVSTRIRAIFQITGRHSSAVINS